MLGNCTGCQKKPTEQCEGQNLHQFTFQVSPSPAPWAPSQHLADKGRMLREVQWFQLSQRTHLSLLPALLTCSPIARSTDAAHRAQVLLLSQCTLRCSHGEGEMSEGRGRRDITAVVHRPAHLPAAVSAGALQGTPELTQR